MKLCKDCAHVQTLDLSCRFATPLPAYMWKCHAPQNVAETDPIDGSDVLRFDFCRTHRQGQIVGTCGKEGKWWTPWTPPKDPPKDV